MTPEGKLKAEVIDFLKASGLFWLRLNSGIVKVRGGFMHLCPEGTSDLLIFPPGRIIWCELKVEGQTTAKKRAAKQQEFRDKVLAEGHEHIRCESLLELQLALSLKIN